MSRIFWPNEESWSLRKRFGCGVRNSVPTMPETEAASGGLGDVWHLDEVFIRINGQQQYLWRGSRRRRDRHPGSTASRSTRGGTIISKTAARPGTRTTLYHYRQTKKLFGRAANDPVRDSSRHRTLRQQSRRSLASTDPPQGTADAPIQVCWPSPTVSLSLCRPESFSS
jgi:hypothetical protein